MSIYAAFIEQVERTPDAIAVVDERGQVTFRELALIADDIASRLPEEASFIGIILDHGIEMIASMLAVLKAGAAYVPAEHDFPLERIAFMLGECDADAVITQAGYEGVADGRPTILVEPGAELARLAELRKNESETVSLSKARPEDLAYVLYTSGTTGTPKGVSVENRNVTSYIRAFQHEFNNGPGDRMLQHSVCSFDIFTEEVYSTLLTGGTLVIAPAAVKADIKALVEFIDENEITIVDGFPYLLEDINLEAKRPNTVRLYISGGDVIHESQVTNLVNEAMVYNTYGPSETTCCVAYYRCDGAQPEKDGTYPTGRAILGTRIDVVDEELQPVPQGEIGEFLITGPGVSRGYLGKHPEQANFIVDGDGTRHYRSGDMGYLRDDGNLIFLHRKDEQVMIKGKRVEAKEVENVLLEDSAVRQAVVVPRKDEQGFSYLTAYVAPMERDFSFADLKARMRLHLTEFMIPEFFVEVDAIPLNTHGKPAVEKLPVVLK